MPTGIYPRSEKEKLRIQNLRKNTIPWNKNKPWSIEVKTKISNSHKGWIPPAHVIEKFKLRVTGKNNFNWKGGISAKNEKIRKSKKYKIWREAVFKRDNWTCVLCFKKGVILNADHIKKFAYFPKLRLKLSNGRTLCVPCHKKTDNYKNKKI